MLRRGFAKLAEAETLYFPLGPNQEPRLPPEPHPGTITAREVSTDPEIDSFMRLGEAIFGDPAPAPEYVQQIRSEVRRSVETTGHSELFLSYFGTNPVGRGGLSVTGRVGRLWTAGVLPEYRGRGAYMALVTERCRSALEQGAELVLTHAKVGTSEPILKGHGFQSAGQYTRTDEARSILPVR